LFGPSGSNAVVEASADLAAWTPIQTNALPPFGLDISVPLVRTNSNSSARACTLNHSSGSMICE